MTTTFHMNCNTGEWPLTIESGKGVIDGHAVEVFTRGQCHALAYALNERTGWPIHLLTYSPVDAPEDIDDDAPLDEWDHAVVRHPDGRFVDINGAWQLESSEWGVDYGLAHTVEVSPEYVAAQAANDYHMNYFEDLPTTGAFADTVLANL